jgi:hypothetical protein
VILKKWRKTILKNIKSKIIFIFDVGCRKDSEMTNFKGTVHYFNPVK